MRLRPMHPSPTQFHDLPVILGGTGAPTNAIARLQDQRCAARPVALASGRHPAESCPDDNDIIFTPFGSLGIGGGRRGCGSCRKPEAALYHPASTECPKLTSLLFLI